MSKIIGIDIGGTKIAGGIVDQQGKISRRQERPTPVLDGGPKILQEAILLAKELIDSTNEPIEAIGIGAGGQIDSKNGYVYSATDVIPGWSGLRIVDAFKKKLNRPAFVDNDVNVLGLSESRFGAASKFKNGCIVFLSLGTGVGGAILIDGKLHHGSHFSGGELGHILLSMDPDARMDLGGARGTLEAYCSGPGMVMTFKELAGIKDANISGHEVVEDATKNPGGFGSQAIFKTGEYLGFGLASLANALDPDLIVIGGGLSELKDALLDPARSVFTKHALPGPAKCPVVRAQLGVDAPIVGAACLAMDAT